MSDSLRKGFGEQAQEKITPDSQKSTTDKIGENVSGATDKVVGAVQPDSEKSTTQKLGDSTRSHGDNAQKEGGSLLDSTKETLGGAANTVSDTLSNAANSVTGATKDSTK
jgi:flagellar hook-basal body complex protein FliE